MQSRRSTFVTHTCAAADLDVDGYREVRCRIKDIVLMTDMSHHSRLVQYLDSLVAACPAATGPELLAAFVKKEDRAVALQMIVHAADISNTCRPPGPCGLWAKRVTDGAAPHVRRLAAQRLQRCASIATALLIGRQLARMPEPYVCNPATALAWYIMSFSGYSLRM